MVTVMNLHPVNLSPTPASTHVSHWWPQEGHPAEIAPVCQQSPTLVGRSEPLNKGVYDIKFGHFGLLIST